MADEFLAARIADDDTAGLGDDGAAALLNLAALAAEIIDVLRPLPRRADRERRQHGGGRHSSANGR